MPLHSCGSSVGVQTHASVEYLTIWKKKKTVWSCKQTPRNPLELEAGGTSTLIKASRHSGTLWRKEPCQLKIEKPCQPMVMCCGITYSQQLGSSCSNHAAIWALGRNQYRSLTNGDCWFLYTHASSAQLNCNICENHFLWAHLFTINLIPPVHPQQY